ncbi:hypothetical protein ABVT39_008034 [Epinephelus coioides]
MLSSAVLCVLTVSLLSASEDSQEMKVKAEQDVTLQCHARTDAPITLLEWSRPDLDTGDYVFLYRNERSYERYQHPSYRGRVVLREPDMKNGDASVILRNVNINDTGTYKCEITVSNTGHSQTPDSEIQLLKLNVTVDSGHIDGNKDGNLGLLVGVPVSVGLVLILVLGIVGSFIFIQRPRKKDHSYTSAEKAGEPGI